MNPESEGDAWNYFSHDQARSTTRASRPSAARYDRDGHELASRGLYLELPAWGHHAFEVTSR
jgi:hypothetical protein